MQIKTIRKRFDFSTIQNPSDKAKETFELDKFSQKVTGILLTSDRDEQLFHRGTFELQINGEEVFPEGYHGKLLISGLGVAPKDRYFPLELDPGNGMVKAVFTDNANPSQAHSPYNVYLYLEIEIKVDGGE